MYALVEILSKQYKVKVGDLVTVDLLHSENESKVKFDSVLAVIEGDNAKFGTPYIKGASVEATVVTDELRGKKIKVYKYHRRKGYRRTQGHRESYSVIKIDSIKA